MSFEAIAIIATALAFDYVNGFHDAANSIATVVSTRVLSPRLAVAWAAFWNFIAFAVFGTAVASAIGKGTIDLSQAASLDVMLAALIGAIAWDLITWYYGIPSSSSHALVGGLAGAAVAYAGPDALVASGILKIAVFIVLSPVIGLTLGIVLMNIVLVVAQLLTGKGVPLTRMNGAFRKMQLISAAAYSLGHGANDAQKTMGVIAAVILIDRGGGIADFEVTLPIVLAAHTAIALGTLSGGWRIVHTLGSKITKLNPVGGFSAETAAAVTLFSTAAVGIPVSTTHTITGAVVGVGATNRISGVRWGLTGRVVYAWIVTLPASALMAAISLKLLDIFPADVVVPIAFIVAASGSLFFLVRRRRGQPQVAIFAPPPA